MRLEETVPKDLTMSKKKKKKKPQSWFHKPEDKTSWFSRSMYAKEFYLDNGGKLATD